MRLIVDANVIFSALISTQGKTFDLIYRDDLRLFAPEFLMEEFNKYKEEILLKSGLTESDFDLFFSLITSKIEFIPKLEFKKFIPLASR